LNSSPCASRMIARASGSFSTAMRCSYQPIASASSVSEAQSLANVLVAAGSSAGGSWYWSKPIGPPLSELVGRRRGQRSALDDRGPAYADANTNGDEIILTPGTYTVSSQLSNTHQISLHGEAGQPRPVIHGNVSTLDVLNLTGGASLSDLEVDLIGTSHAAAVELAGT